AGAGVHRSAPVPRARQRVAHAGAGDRAVFLRDARCLLDAGGVRAGLPARSHSEHPGPALDDAGRATQLHGPHILDLVRDADRSAGHHGAGRSHARQPAGRHPDRRSLSGGRHADRHRRTPGRRAGRLPTAARLRVKQYILRRLALVVPTLFLVSVIVFALMRLMPGDVATRMVEGPNTLPTIIVVATPGLSTIILPEASLSFLGLGVPPPFPTWGGMLSLAGLRHMYQAPWLAIWAAG